MHNNIKAKLRALADCEQLPKFRVMIDPLVFASDKVRDDVRQFLLKMQNSTLSVNERSRSKCLEVEKTFDSFGNLGDCLNECQRSIAELQLRSTEERALLCTRRTLEQLRLMSAEKERQQLQGQLREVEKTLQQKQEIYREVAEEKSELERLTAKLHSDIASHNEQIIILEEGATNQNEVARRMVQMDLLQKQLTALEATYQKELARRSTLTAAIERNTD